MNLSNCFTITTVEFCGRFRQDRVFIDGKEVLAEKKERVVNILDIIRKKSRIDQRARVVSKNNFPADAGIASSASAFSALALAASKAAGLDISLRELSILARFGSGSACRSVVDGFAEWKKGRDNQTSFAVQLAPPEHWELGDVVVVVSKEKKKASSTEGHAAAITSPHYKTRIIELRTRIKDLRKVLLKKQFERLGQLLEEEAVSLHMVAMTSNPPIFYWNEGTMEVMRFLHQIRERGLFGFFTMDAGPNIHVICRQKDMEKINRQVKKLKNVLFTIKNRPCIGTKLVKKHLF